MAGTGAKAVRFHDLFWRTLEPHRGQGYYDQLREKLSWFIERKGQTLDPVSSRDNLFRNSGGIWHFAIQRTPDVVVFYTVADGTLNLAMVGSHHDYPHAGKQYSAMDRTIRRVSNALAEGSTPSPLWRDFRWDDPARVLSHPDLAELSPGVLDDLIDELDAETRTGDRYMRRTGTSLLDSSKTPVEVFDAYIATLEAAIGHVVGIRASGLMARPGKDVTPSVENVVGRKRR